MGVGGWGQSTSKMAVEHTVALEKAVFSQQVFITPDKVHFFNEKILTFFHENICCGFSLEVPH